MSFIISADTSYILQTESDHTVFNLSHIYTYLDYNNINVDDIIDNNQDTSLVNKLQSDFELWYNTNAEDIQKSVIFYKYAKSLHEWINHQIDEFSETLSNSKLIDLRKSINNQRFINIDKYNKYITGINNAFDTLYKLSNIKHTLREALIYESNRVKIQIDDVIINPRNEYIFESDIIDQDIRRITHTHDNDKKSLKRAKRILNKSIKCLQSFIGYNNVKSFIKGNEFSIEGKYFNYKIYNKKQYKLLDDKLSSVHIPYNLDLYNKQDEYLSNMCITFNGCPILDQILSVYLMIQSNQEHILFENSNHYNKSSVFSSSIEQYDLINNIVNNSGCNFSFDSHDITLYKSIKKNHNRKNKIKKYFMDKVVETQMPSSMYNFIFESVESWDEIIDLFSINQSCYETSLDYIVAFHTDKG